MSIRFYKFSKISHNYNLKGRLHMDSKASTPNAKGFYIWFNKKEKKEYYATPMTLYKVKVNKSKNSKYSYN